MLVTPIPGNGALALAWRAPADNNGAAIIGYKVRWVLAAATTSYLNVGGANGADVSGGA